MASILGDAEAVRLYEDVGDYAAIKAVFEEILALYNAKRKPMSLVFFEDALEHLTRVHRTIRLPQVGAGVGSGGVGMGHLGSDCQMNLAELVPIGTIVHRQARRCWSAYGEMCTGTMGAAASNRSAAVRILILWVLCKIR